MQQPETPTALDAKPSVDEPAVPSILEWIWRPWYAKLWWIAIPVYWAPGGLPGFRWFVPIYTSSVGIFLNIFLLPLTALMILGFGYFRQRLDADGWDDPAGARSPGRPHWWLDPLDPMSPFWTSRNNHKH